MLDGLSEGGQLLHHGGVAPQAIANAREGPAEQSTRLDGHQPVGDLAEHVGGGEAKEFLVLDPPQQVGAGGAPDRMGLEVGGQCVGIDEHHIPGQKVGEGHGPSGGGGKSSSGSLAKRSASSALPFQPQMPAVCSTQLVFGWMVSRTFSCSLSGNGCSNLSMPFS